MGIIESLSCRSLYISPPIRLSIPVEIQCNIYDSICTNCLINETGRKTCDRSKLMNRLWPRLWKILSIQNDNSDILDVSHLPIILCILWALFSFFLNISKFSSIFSSICLEKRIKHYEKIMHIKKVHFFFSFIILLHIAIRRRYFKEILTSKRNDSMCNEYPIKRKKEVQKKRFIICKKHICF